jgi:S1-C subfamily serine protease
MKHTMNFAFHKFNDLRVKHVMKKLLIVPVVLFAFASTLVAAGDEYSEEHIKREISYLAKKLLDMSGKKSVTVEAPAFDRPFIGICAEITPEGVKITCVTPGTQAAKNGLRTGDIVTRMKGVDQHNNGDMTRTKRGYYNIVENMKTGEQIPMSLIRDGKPMELVVTVGSLSHPAYTLKVGE